ncbi:MAG: hypothetical protein ACLFUJ_06430 [Phycisphaerae bacterium]
MRRAVFAVLVLSLTSSMYAQGWGRDDQGRYFVKPIDVPAEANNPWPQAWQDAFARRVDRTIRHYEDIRPKGNTWGENEKAAYPQTMFALLVGRHTDQAVKVLQADDYQKDDHRHTNFVDFYWCFTLKGQMRKFFYFGHLLDDEYRAKFLEGAKTWTEQDPYRRPHPVHGKGDRAKGGWGPEKMGSWVDIRRTDNLRAMTDSSVYLMAERTGNEQTRRLYKQRLAAYVNMLYNVGMMEWDSSNYLGHTMAPYHNLYDFAEDPEVRLIAKAALDWLYAAGALKYWRGGYGGPNNRDYGQASKPWGAPVSHPLGLYFGSDAPIEDPISHYDDLHHITSAYRPPAAVVELAHKNIRKPVEILATKPHYDLWTGGDVAPMYYETQYIGRTFQIGSAVSRDPMRPWNPNVFKMMAFNSKRGVDYFAASTTDVWDRWVKNAGDQIAQYRNLLIWLRPAEGERRFTFQLPKTARRETAGGVIFIRYEKTWLALRPIGLGKLQPAELPDVTDRKTKEKKPNPKIAYYDGSDFFVAEIAGRDGYAGFALEVGEGDDFEAFKKAVLAKSKLDLSDLSRGVVQLAGAGGATVKIVHNKTNDLPAVWRNGQAVDYTTWRDVYDPVDGQAPIRQEYRSGVLRVQSDNHVFVGTFQDGKYSFENRKK